MLFSSIPFLYYFLPIVCLCYFLVPKSLKNATLLFFSLFFYGWGEPKNVIWMLSSILAGYFLGILIERAKTKGEARIWLMVSCVTSFAFLGYFKYYDFFVSNINQLTGLEVPLLRIALPIGISFYTFQIVSYTVDVYRKEAKAQYNFVAFAAYVSLFPQLIAGPIVRYVDIEKQLRVRTSSTADVYAGLQRFLIGLGKKVLFADQFGKLCSIYTELGDKTVLFTWMYAIAFTLQIYLDFSGYSDMAIGLGRIFGFHFMENFRYPYMSKSITEFWRRWHISLGSWFRDYVYIPLGGNRVSKGKWFRNIFIVWMLTGFWHGAAWNFILWGLFFAVLLLLEKVWIGKRLEKASGWIQHSYVMLLVVLSFVLFNAQSLTDVMETIHGMFGGFTWSNQVTEYYLRSYLLLFVYGMIGCTNYPAQMVGKIKGRIERYACSWIVEPIFLCVVLLLTTACLVDNSFHPFLYFRF